MTFKLSRISASPRYSDPLKGPHKFRHFRETGPWYSNSWPIFLSSWEFDFEDGFARLQNALRKVAFTILRNTLTQNASDSAAIRFPMRRLLYIGIGATVIQLVFHRCCLSLSFRLVDYVGFLICAAIFSRVTPGFPLLIKKHSIFFALNFM